MSDSKLLGHFGSSAVFTFATIGGFAAVGTSLGVAPDSVANAVTAYFAPVAALLSPWIPADWVVLLLGAVLLTAMRCQFGPSPQLAAAIVAPVIMLIEFSLYWLPHDNLLTHPLCGLGQAVCDSSSTAQIIVLGACSFVLLSEDTRELGQGREVVEAKVAEDKSDKPKDKTLHVRVGSGASRRKRSKSLKRK